MNDPQFSVFRLGLQSMSRYNDSSNRLFGQQVCDAKQSSGLSCFERSASALTDAFGLRAVGLLYQE